MEGGEVEGSSAVRIGGCQDGFVAEVALLDGGGIAGGRGEEKSEIVHDVAIMTTKSDGRLQIGGERESRESKSSFFCEGGMLLGFKSRLAALSVDIELASYYATVMV